MQIRKADVSKLKKTRRSNSSRAHDLKARKIEKTTQSLINSGESNEQPASFDEEVEKTEIELKSLILAQIERWRHALHMQVERQHGELALRWRVANG